MTDFLGPSENPNGYVLMIHGLNLNPAKMLPLAASLRDMGLSVANLHLSGHRPGTDWTKVTRQVWLSEVKVGYDMVKAKALENHAPLYLVAYSLGGLLAVDLMAHDSGVRFDRAVLFSPALEIRAYTYLINAFSLSPSLIIPSLSPSQYRYNSGTSMAAYQALFQSVKAIHQASLAGLNIPTTVFIDPKDELVSFDKLENLVHQQNLSQWKINVIHNDGSSLEKNYHHLVIDEAAVGMNQWKIILNSIHNNLIEGKLE